MSTACTTSTHCCMEAVLLAEIEMHRHTLLKGCFDEAERSGAETLSLPSLAGRVAAKRAVCRLLGAPLVPKDVSIEKKRDGAPRISSPQIADVLISISHTKTAAVGFAARAVRREP